MELIGINLGISFKSYIVDLKVLKLSLMTDFIYYINI